MFYYFKTSSLLSFGFLFILGACTNGGEEAQRQERQTQIQQQVVVLTDNFKSEMETLLALYFDLKDALVESDSDEAASKAEDLGEFSTTLDTSELNTETAAIWDSYLETLQTETETITGTGDVEEQRVAFEAVSETMIHLVDSFRPLGYEVYQQSCPMVRGDSADWLSRNEQIENPYYGEKMLNCGGIVRKI